MFYKKYRTWPSFEIFEIYIESKNKILLTSGAWNPFKLTLTVFSKLVKDHCAALWCMVFNTTFNNISVISWRSDLPQVTDKLYHIRLYRAHLACVKFDLTTLVVIGTDCIGSYKSNYHTITTMTAPQQATHNYHFGFTHPYVSWCNLSCITYNFIYFVKYLTVSHWKLKIYIGHVVISNFSFTKRTGRVIRTPIILTPTNIWNYSVTYDK